MKTCSKCGLSKSEGEFTKDNRNKNGLGAACLACKNIKQKDSRNKKPKESLTPRARVLRKIVSDMDYEEFAVFNDQVDSVRENVDAGIDSDGILEILHRTGYYINTHGGHIGNKS